MAHNFFHKFLSELYYEALESLFYEYLTDILFEISCSIGRFSCAKDEVSLGDPQNISRRVET